MIDAMDDLFNAVQRASVTIYLRPSGYSWLYTMT